MDTATTLVPVRPYPPTPAWRTLLAIIAGTILYTPLLGRFGFLGMDWLVYFAVERFGNVQQRPNPVYPPWVIPILLRPLTTLSPYTGLAILNGLTLATLVVLTFSYARFTRPDARLYALISVVLVVLCPLPWMELWLGQNEVLILLGLALMPLGMPLLIGKLHLGVWAVLGSRRNILWAAGWVLLSLMIWGLWPLTSLRYSVPADASNPHPILMGWGATSPIFALLGVILLLFSNRDPLRLIAAGTFISPYMMPYHYLILLPAFGRVRAWQQVILWLTTLTLLFEVGFSTPESKIIALSFPLLVWIFLAPSLELRHILRDPDTLFNRAWATIQQMRTLPERYKRG